MKSMNDSQKVWYKFYECDCHNEGIMISYENEDVIEGKKYKRIDMAFFGHGLTGLFPLFFLERLRWCWFIIRKGRPFLDEVILKKETAKELGQDLLDWANE